MTRHMGVDWHRKSFTVCTRTADGRYETATWPTSRLLEWSQTLQSTDQVAVETTGQTRWFYEVVRPRVARLVVVNTLQFAIISRSVKKTDARDARLLCEYLYQGLLPEVRMKDKTLHQLASLAQTRDKLVKLRTVLKNKINGLLAGQGIVLEREALSSDRALEAVRDYRFDAMVMIELKVLVDQILSLNRSIRELEETLRKEGETLEGQSNLTSIKGIGPLSASILLSVIGNVQDFAGEDKLAAYFGIVPRVHNSSDTVRSGSITKHGSKLGRTTLIQCALVAKRYSPYLSEFYERIKARRGGGKAIVALARKFLGIIYRTLKNKWVFEDFPNFVLAK